MNAFEHNLEFDHPVIAATAWWLMWAALGRAVIELSAGL